MREVLRTHSLSWAETARVSLEAEGIDAVIQNQHPLGFIGLAGELRVVVDDRDAGRAVTILRSLGRPASKPVSGARAWKGQRRGNAEDAGSPRIARRSPAHD